MPDHRRLGALPARRLPTGGARRPRTALAWPGLVLLLAFATPAAAQVDTSSCEAVVAVGVCRTATDLAVVMTVRGASIATAGNPVAGTASTLGMRQPGAPRIALAVRRTGGGADLPEGAGAGGSTSASAWSGEVAVGLLEGFSPFPTVGGLLSLDLLASVSVVQFPSADGFRTRAPTSFALGARLGILRESFTLPGISLSAMYRRTGRVTFGDLGLQTRDLYVRVERTGTWSARAVAGKRLGVLGFTAGAGIDRHTARGVFRVPGPVGTPVAFGFEDVVAERRSVFAGVSWTLLIFNFSGEFGWQLDAGGERGGAGKGGPFAGAAVRVTY